LNWFQRLTGFHEVGYEATQRRLRVEDGRLHSLVNGASWSVGTLELPTLAELREAEAEGDGHRGRLRVSNVVGDVGWMHLQPEYEGALFQVASQFNLLEMVSPGVTPEDGVGRYEQDLTQGPACAIAAGAATMYRNYLVPVGGRAGQTRDRQIDCLAGVGELLAARLQRPVGSLWQMRNGYALCSREGLAAIGRYLDTAGPEAVDALRAALMIGLHSDVEVTEERAGSPPSVSQAFCSALPVAYGNEPGVAWAPFATLVLEAAYEATLWAALANARAGVSDIVLLTRLGGGAFGNADAWIDAAMTRALDLVRDLDLDVRLVSYGSAHPSLIRIEQAFA
jgi:hypothetical protein